jgi:hypothetical protein
VREKEEDTTRDIGKYISVGIEIVNIRLLFVGQGLHRFKLGLNWV